MSENKFVEGEADNGSVQSVEPALDNGGEIELQLTLGWGPVKRQTALMTPRVGLDLSG